MRKSLGFAAVALVVLLFGNVSFANTSHGNPWTKKQSFVRYRGFVEAGYAIGSGDLGRGINRVEVYTSHGCGLGKYFFVGAGVGLNSMTNDMTSVPLYFDARIDYPDLLETMLPYVDLKYGIDALDSETFYSASLGWRFALGKRLGMSVSVGYVMQEMDRHYIKGDRDIPGTYEEHVFREEYGGVSWKICLDF